VARWVALLRGVNVGGARKLAMSDLRALVAGAGGFDVETYIQSGNVVFSHAARSAAGLETDLERVVGVPVMVRSPAELAKIVRDNPYPGTEGTKLVVWFFKERVTPATLKQVDTAKFAPEAFAPHGRELYLHLPDGQGRAKLTVALGRRVPDYTARNWQTVVKLLEMAST